MRLSDLFETDARHNWGDAPYPWPASKNAGFASLDNLASYEWTLEPEFPVDKIDPQGQSHEDWIDFLHSEIWSEYDEGDEDRADMWGLLITQPIRVPIVLINNRPNFYELFDGQHRYAATLASGRTTIPVVIGRLNKIE